MALAWSPPALASPPPQQRLDSAPRTPFSQLRRLPHGPADGLPGPPPPTLWKHQPDVRTGACGRRRKWLGPGAGGEHQPGAQAGLARLRERPESTPPPPHGADQGPEDQEAPGQTPPRLGEHMPPSWHQTRCASVSLSLPLHGARGGGQRSACFRPRPPPACCPPLLSALRHLQRLHPRVLGPPGPDPRA